MTEPDCRRKIGSDNQVLISLVLATVLIHLLCSSGYGYFRDELYAIACSKHLAWGYVDQPPFSEFILFISGHLLGYSLDSRCGFCLPCAVGWWPSWSA